MSDQLVTLWRFRDLPEALLAQSKLESAGIESFLADETLVAMNWFLSNAVGGVRLQVRPEDEENALDILSEPAPGSYSAAETHDETGETYIQPRCPRCASMEIALLNHDPAITLPPLALAAIPIPVSRSMWICDDCGHAWEDAQLLEQDRGPDFSMPLAYVATSNRGKLHEYQRMSRGHAVEVQPLPGLDQATPVEESGASYAENAGRKAMEYSRLAPGEVVLADDSGIEVDALDGEPGVRSARYAATGPDHTNPRDQDNNYKLLHELSLRPDKARTARFVCVIAAARDGELLATFEGEAHGEVLLSALGKRGFGYDPLFYYAPLNKTFAEMTDAEKDEHSHRGAAFRKFLDWMVSRAG